MYGKSHKGSGRVVKNGRQMSYISGHRSLPVYIIFPEPFLRKKTRACPGNWEDSLRQSTQERWQFPCLPLPCLVFTSKTTEKAHIIYSVTNKKTEARKGIWTKSCATVVLPSKLGEASSCLKGFSGALWWQWHCLTDTGKAHLRLSPGYLVKAATQNMLMAVKSCPINLHIIGKSTLWNVKALLHYEILHMTSVVKTSEVTAASGCWRSKSKFSGISRNMGNAPNSPSGTALTG